MKYVYVVSFYGVEDDFKLCFDDEYCVNDYLHDFAAGYEELNAEYTENGVQLSNEYGVVAEAVVEKIEFVA